MRKLKKGDVVTFIGPEERNGGGAFIKGEAYILRTDEWHDSFYERVSVIADSNGKRNGWLKKYFKLGNTKLHKVLYTKDNS